MLSGLRNRFRRRSSQQSLEGGPPIAADRQVVVSGLMSKAITGVVIVLVACGPVALGATFLVGGSDAAPAVQKHDDGRRADMRARAGELASRVVVAWLAATQDDSEDLEELAPTAEARFGDKPVAVSDLQVASIRGGEGGSWSVTVAATVGGDGDRRYFQVSIAAAEADRLAVLALPTPVSGTRPAEAGRLDYDHSASTSDPIHEAVSAFLDAYSAGQGDVDRLSSPGSGLHAIDPAPYRDIEITSLRSGSDGDEDGSTEPDDGHKVRVHAFADATVSDEQSVTVSYALTLTARDGRWEIAQIDDVPARDVGRSDSGESGEEGKNR